jgi:hypothetical protein
MTRKWLGRGPGLTSRSPPGLCACTRRHDPPDAAGGSREPKRFHVESTGISQSPIYRTPPDGPKPKISHSSATLASIKMTDLYARQLLPRLVLAPMMPALRHFDAVPLATGCRSRWIRAAVHGMVAWLISIVCWLAMAATLDPCSA